MAETTHTPGPWEFVFPHHICAENRGTTVAKVKQPTNRYYGNDARTPQQADVEREANGHLMAAAPEFYRAVAPGLDMLGGVRVFETLVTAVRRHIDDDDDLTKDPDATYEILSDAEQVIDDIRAALAKAEVNPNA